MAALLFKQINIHYIHNTWEVRTVVVLTHEYNNYPGKKNIFQYQSIIN